MKNSDVLFIPERKNTNTKKRETNMHPDCGGTERTGNIDHHLARTTIKPQCGWCPRSGLPDLSPLCSKETHQHHHHNNNSIDLGAMRRRGGGRRRRSNRLLNAFKNEGALRTLHHCRLILLNETLKKSRKQCENETEKGKGKRK